MAGLRSRAQRHLQLPEAISDPVALSLTGATRRVDGFVRELLADGVVVAARGSEIGRSVPGGEWVDVFDPWTIGSAAGERGGVGEITATAGEYVWVASPNVENDLEVLDFDIYVKGGSGSPRVIASSMPDFEDQGWGRNIVPPQWRERLQVLGRHVVWSETVRRTGSPDDPLRGNLDMLLGTAVNIAPLDGKSAVQELAAGWFPSVDRCAEGGATLTYLDSSESQTPPTGRAALHSVVLDESAHPLSDDVIWEQSESDDGEVFGAEACGDVIAVSWSGPIDEETWWSGLEVVHDGTTTLIENPDGGTIVHPSVTERFVLFHVAEGDLGGSDFLYDFESGEVHRISANTGRPDAAFLSRTHLVWPVSVQREGEDVGIEEEFYTLVAPLSP